MGAISLNKADNLYWLGRYAERALVLSDYLYRAYDRGIGPGNEDEGQSAVSEFCQRLGIQTKFASRADFLRHFFLEQETPYSMAWSVKKAYENGFVLRDLLTNEVFAYLRMGMNTIESLRNPDFFEIKDVIDYLYAFWGSLDEWVPADGASIARWGRLSERMEILYRFAERERIKDLGDKLQRVFFILDLPVQLDWEILNGDAIAAVTYLNGLFPAAYGTGGRDDEQGPL